MINNIKLNNILKIDKYSRYEVTLVALTGHIKPVNIAVQNTLENEVYRTQDLDVKRL